MEEKLFRPYCSAWPGGIGLGLSIVRQLALAQGWRVGYRPNPGGGSVFWISGIEITELDHERDKDREDESES
jgi:nitrogen-specific signal transduction histidine kinase